MIVGVADFCVCLLFQNEEVGYPGRHSLGGFGRNPWIHLDGLEVFRWIGGYDGIVMIDISIEPLC